MSVKQGFNRLHKALTNDFGVSVRWLPGGGGGTPHKKGVGMLVGIFELNH